MIKKKDKVVAICNINGVSKEVEGTVLKVDEEDQSVLVSIDIEDREAHVRLDIESIEPYIQPAKYLTDEYIDLSVEDLKAIVKQRFISGSDVVQLMHLANCVIVDNYMLCHPFIKINGDFWDVQVGTVDHDGDEISMSFKILEDDKVEIKDGNFLLRDIHSNQLVKVKIHETKKYKKEYPLGIGKDK